MLYNPVYLFPIIDVTNYYKFSGLKHTQIYYLTVQVVRSPKWSHKANKVSFPDANSPASLL